MAAATVASVRTVIASHLHLAAGPDGDPLATPPIRGLATHWDDIIVQSHAEAEAWLREALNGFSLQAVAQWRMFEHYHRRLAVLLAEQDNARDLAPDLVAAIVQSVKDLKAEILAIESIGDDPDDESDDLVLGGRMSRSDDLFRAPSVGSGGSLPGDVFNTTRTTWARDVRV